jgi:hypothetical protein
MTLFKKAERTKLKLRLGIEGPSGSGKTYSSLRIATGLVGESGKIGVVDTENNSASLYSEKFNFEVGVLNPPYKPETFVEYIKEAENIFDCVILDSISHEWIGQGGVLEIHDTMPGNPWINWAKVNPRHDAFVNAILQCKTHIICTMRSKQTHVQEQDSSGKQVIRKAGMQPQQRDGIDYELTAVLTMDISNQCQGTKDRSGLFPIGDWFRPTEETGKKLLNWLNHGKEIPPIERQITAKEVSDFWNGRILKGGIVVINQERIKPTEEQIEKLKQHEKYKQNNTQNQEG